MQIYHVVGVAYIINKIQRTTFQIIVRWVLHMGHWFCIWRIMWQTWSMYEMLNTKKVPIWNPGSGNDIIAFSWEKIITISCCDVSCTLLVIHLTAGESTKDWAVKLFWSKKWNISWFYRYEKEYINMCTQAGACWSPDSHNRRHCFQMDNFSLRLIVPVFLLVLLIQSCSYTSKC